MPSKKILIVEDDSDQLRGLAVRLKASGYDVFGAPDGVTAISMTRQEKPDLVLLDLGLPAGDGFFVMERIRDMIPFSTIPIIVLSARDSAGNKEKAHKAGALAFFQKPVDSSLLVAAVRRVFAQLP